MKARGHASVTFRLTFLFALVSTIVLLALGLLIGSLVERHFEELDMQQLTGKLALVRHTLGTVEPSQDRRALADRLDASFIGHDDIAVAIWERGGQRLYATADADLPPPELRSTPAPSASRPVRWTGSSGRRFRGISGEASLAGSERAPLFVTISTDLVHHEHFMRSFQVALWSGVALAALVSGLLGWGVARQGLAPLRRICRDASGITAARLHQRLPEDAIPNELAEVTRTLNEMLARLEESFQRLSDFSSDLAHELRTPVSNLLTQTQVTLSKTRTVTEYREVLASNAEEFERLARIIADMLFLAKADNHLVVPQKERFSLRREADGLLEFYAAVADEHEIRCSVDGEAWVSGDRLMLRRAISNLLSNAFRHTPDGGKITLRLGMADDQTVTVTVENSGETIAAEHLPRLFDRFYRADPSRKRLDEGAGLGLAITRSIVRAHGGEASVSSANGMTSFVLKLPA